MGTKVHFTYKLRSRRQVTDTERGNNQSTPKHKDVGRGQITQIPADAWVANSKQCKKEDTLHSFWPDTKLSLMAAFWAAFAAEKRKGDTASCSTS